MQEMALWEQIALTAIGLLVLFMFFPGIKATMERSKNAEEKHWGTLALIAIVLIAFVLLLISSV
ncbi:MAG TPA: hypothetical protein ENJ64_07495 [Thiotrichales bacterium]|nr:hypothetical protein [Thiotrichales bacterium]